jgi:hypothetical protein
MTAAFLAFVLAALVVPIQFVDGHHTRMAEAIEQSGAGPYPVVEVRQLVEEGRTGHVVDAQVADYRTGSGTPTATVSLHGYDGSAVVAEAEGWFVVDGGDDEDVYVTADGRDGFLAADYRLALEGEFDGPYRVADAWIGGWGLVGLVLLTVLSMRRARRGATSTRRALLAPAAYVAVAAVLMASAYGLSFPLAGGT